MPTPGSARYGSMADGSAGSTGSARYEASGASPTKGVTGGLRKVHLTVATLGALLLIAGCAAKPPVRHGAPPSRAPSSGTGTCSPGLATVYGVTTSTAWAGGRCLILRTTDGGKTWAKQYTGPDTITRFDFVNTQVGWALTPRALLATSDGGSKWHTVAHASLRAIGFVSPRAGWALNTPGHLLHTVDAGRTWTAVAGVPALSSLSAVSPQVIWGAVSNVVYLSTDGGKVWTHSQPTGLREGATPSVLAVDARRAWVMFSYASQAYIMHESGYILETTTSGGASWTAAAEQPRFFAGPQGLYPILTHNTLGPEAGIIAYASGATAIIMEKCAVCGEGPTRVAVTHNAGASWAQFPTAPVDGVAGSYPASFVTAQNGWLAGQRHGHDEILTTTDGGRSWTVRIDL